MNKYLSLIFLYNRAGYKKILSIMTAIPIVLTVIGILRVGNPYNADPFMLVEHAFGGVFGVILLIAIVMGSLFTVVNSLNGKKDLKATHATTGYTIRRLRISPIKAYITITVYYFMLIVIFWAITIVSIFLVAKVGLTVSGATDIDMKLALGLLRTEIGHALIPFAHPLVIFFNLEAALALAAECGRACYLSWHNGRQSASIAIIIAPMFIVWKYDIENAYLFLAIIGIFFYMLICVMDIVFRELRPKGDPFLVNKYIGIMDMDSDEFDENVFLDSNSQLEDGEKKTWWLGKFMPIGINMEKANALLGALIFLSAAENLTYYGKYVTALKQIDGSIKGVTIDSGLKMPYFWELQEHAYYGYFFSVIAVIFIQAYWNYSYYNKETNSVYVMKRLPDRTEYARTIWCAPVIEAGIILAVMIVQTAIDFFWYALFTPKIALHTDYLSRILPF